MPYLPFPTVDRRRRFVRPKYPWRINERHPSAVGLQSCWPMMTPNGSGLVDIAPAQVHGNLSPGTTFTPIWIDTVPGGTWAVDFPDSANNILTRASFTPPTEGTVAFWVEHHVIQGRHFGFADAYEVRQASGDWRNELFRSGASATTATIVGAANESMHFATTYLSGSATAQRIYENGVSLSLTSQPTHDSSPGSGTLSIGTRTGSTDYINAALWFFLMWDRILTEAEVYELYDHESRWSLLESYTPPLYFFPAASGATDDNKFSMLHYVQPWGVNLPLSEAAGFDQGDKQQQLWGYPNILWGAAGNVFDEDASLNFAGQLTASPEAIISGLAGASLGASADSDPEAIIEGPASLSPTMSLNAAAALIREGLADINPRILLTGNGGLAIDDTVTLSFGTTGDAAAEAIVNAQAGASVGSSMDGASEGIIEGDGGISPAFTDTAAPEAIINASGGVSPGFTLTATGGLVREVTADLGTFAASLSAESGLAFFETISLDFGASADADPEIIVNGIAAASVGVSASSDPDVVAEAGAAISPQMTASASPEAIISGQAALDATLSLDAAGGVVVEVAADLGTVLATLEALGGLEIDVAADLGAFGATNTSVAQAIINATAGISAALSQGGDGEPGAQNVTAAIDPATTLSATADVTINAQAALDAAMSAAGATGGTFNHLVSVAAGFALSAVTTVITAGQAKLDDFVQVRPIMRTSSVRSIERNVRVRVIFRRPNRRK